MAIKINELNRLIKVKDNTEYRILNFFQGYASCCRMGVQNLDIQIVRLQDIQSGVENGIYRIIKEEFGLFDINLYYPENGDANTTALRQKFLDYRDICSTVYEEYKFKLPVLTSKQPKPLIDSLLKKYSVSRQVFWKIFVRYLQSGLQDESLIDQRHFIDHKNTLVEQVNDSDRQLQKKQKYLLTKADLKNFDKYLHRYLNSQVKTIKEAYLDLIDDKYSVTTKGFDAGGNQTVVRFPLPPDQRPSWWQFYRYVNSNTDKKQRTESKLTAKTVRNNMRPFTGTVMEGVQGPGHYVEMDAQEMDIALVSDEYDNIPVGRPIIYVMIDVMSEIVLGVSLAMDNNSIVGCTNCFMNLIEDKTELFRRYGVSFDFNKGVTIDDLWPTGYKPRVVKFDNGSDFISKPIAHILNELNIREEIVSPGTGSLKPLVENFFGLIKKDLDDLLEHKGLIRQTYGSKHHQEACLTFDDAYRIVLNQVIYHNQHVITTYPKSADMKKKAVIASPMNLWAYGMQNLIPATKFTSRDDALYHMLLPCRDATISRAGILRKGLPYFNADDDELQNLMFQQGNTRAKFECRYDPRDMGHLYYLKNGEMMTLSLPSEDFRYASYYYMSEKRFDELEALAKEQAKLEEEINVQAKINKRRANKAIIDEAAKTHAGRNKTKGMRDARKEEKEYISGQNSAAVRFGLDDNKAPDELPTVETAESISAQDAQSSQTSDHTAEKQPDAESRDKKESTNTGTKKLTLEERRRKAEKEAAEMDWNYYMYGTFTPPEDNES